MIDPIPADVRSDEDQEEKQDAVQDSQAGLRQATITMKFLKPNHRFGFTSSKADAYNSLREKIKMYRPFIEAKMQLLLSQTEPESAGTSMIQDLYEKLMAEIVRDVVMRTEMIEWERNNEFNSTPDPASDYIRALL